MKKLNNYVSRRKTPWSNKNEITSFELFISNIYENNYQIRHNKIIDSNEAMFLNDFHINNCPYCESTCFVKNGKYRSGVQRYYCNCCHKSFNVLTNTIFDNHKISISEWIEFLLYLFGYESIQEISKSNKNSSTTTKFWLKKLFLVLKHYQDNIVLSGVVYIDEMFYKVIKKDVKHAIDGKEYRGLSKNQICIGVAIDNTKVYVKVEGLGKTNDAKTLQTFTNHIKEKSHLIHD